MTDSIIKAKVVVDDSELSSASGRVTAKIDKLGKSIEGLAKVSSGTAKEIAKISNAENTLTASTTSAEQVDKKHQATLMQKAEKIMKVSAASNALTGALGAQAGTIGQVIQTTGALTQAYAAGGAKMLGITGISTAVAAVISYIGEASEKAKNKLEELRKKGEELEEQGRRIAARARGRDGDEEEAKRRVLVTRADTADIPEETRRIARGLIDQGGEESSAGLLSQFTQKLLGVDLSGAVSKLKASDQALKELSQLQTAKKYDLEDKKTEKIQEKNAQDLSAQQAAAEKYSQERKNLNARELQARLDAQLALVEGLSLSSSAEFDLGSAPRELDESGQALGEYLRDAAAQAEAIAEYEAHRRDIASRNLLIDEESNRIKIAQQRAEQEALNTTVASTIGTVGGAVGGAGGMDSVGASLAQPLGAAIGTALLPGVGTAVGGALAGMIGSSLGDGLDRILKIIDVLGPAVDGIAVLFEGLAPLLLILKSAFSAVGLIFAAFNPVIEIVAKTVAGLIDPFLGILQAIVPLIQIIALLIAAVLPLILAFDPLMISIRLLGEAARLLLPGFTWVMDAIKKPVIEFVSTIYNIIAMAWNTIVDWVRTLPFMENFGSYMDRFNAGNQTLVSEYGDDAGRATRENTEAIRENTKTWQDTLDNMPTGYKIGEAAFAAAAGVSGRIGGSTTTTINSSSNFNLRSPASDALRDVRRNGSRLREPGRRRNEDPRN